MKEKKVFRIIIGGSGGQGVLTLGKVLAYTAVHKEFQVSCLPAYGAEMRGGYVYCTLILSNTSELFSPISARADAGVFLNEKSFKMLAQYLKSNGYLFLNSSLIKKLEDRKFRIFEIPASELAESTGSLQSANMVMAGALSYLLNKELGPLSLEDVRAGCAEVIPGKTPEAVEKSLQIGWQTMEEKWK